MTVPVSLITVKSAITYHTQLTPCPLLVSFDTWPGSNQTKTTTFPDNEYLGLLPSKTYMMGVSPYFYTRISEFNKNWYSSSDSLWYDRWLQVLEVMPDMVQIITWNDFGESHYIGAEALVGHVLDVVGGFLENLRVDNIANVV